MSDTVSRCTICQETKPIGEFRHRRSRGGNVRKSRCKPCDDQWRKELSQAREEGARPDDIRTSNSRTV